MHKVLFPVVILSFMSIASAAPLLYEPFSYTPGTVLAPQSPDGGIHTWAKCGTSTYDEPQAIAGNLSVPPVLGPSVGNSASFGGKGFTDRINVLASGPAITEGSVFYSMAVRIAGTGSVTGGAIVAGFNNTAGPQSTNPTVGGAVLWTRTGATAGTFNLGISVNTGTAGRTYSTTDFTNGSTVFAVASYEYVSGTGNDVARMWLFAPDATLSPDTMPAPTVTAGAGSDMNWVASFLLYQNNASNLPEACVTVDELRVGRAWSDVVPEPASLAILGLGTLFLRRRRHA